MKTEGLSIMQELLPGIDSSFFILNFSFTI